MESIEESNFNNVEEIRLKTFFNKISDSQWESELFFIGGNPWFAKILSDKNEELSLFLYSAIIPENYAIIVDFAAEIFVPENTSINPLFYNTKQLIFDSKTSFINFKYEVPAWCDLMICIEKQEQIEVGISMKATPLLELKNDERFKMIEKTATAKFHEKIEELIAKMRQQSAQDTYNFHSCSDF